MNDANTNTETATRTAPEKTEHTLQTKLHRYHYNLTNDAGRKAWKDLQAGLIADGVKCQEMWGDVNGPASLPNNAQETVEDVTIELACIFEDQWNTTTDRVFDWYKFYEVRGRKCARGHWLEITPAMAKARRDTLKCGYCGKHYGPFHTPAPADGFCRACLTSEYLKESELHLLRLHNLASERNYNDHTVPESLRAEYHGQQVKGTEQRTTAKRVKQHAGILEKFQDKLDAVTKENGRAVIERDGMLWLWERGIDIDNVIYYSHTQTFSVGWRDALKQSEAEKVSNILETDKAPFKYEIKRA